MSVFNVLNPFHVLRTVKKNVQEVIDDPAQAGEKVKDLPLYVLQTALSGVGHALMLTDRVRTALRQLTEDEDKDGRAAGPAAAAEPEDAPPARREPVIFAPRPSQKAAGQKAGLAETTAPARGEDRAAAAPAKSGRPEPVIFSPRPAEAPANGRTDAKPAAKPATKPAAGATAPGKTGKAGKAGKAGKTETAGKAAPKAKPAPKPAAKAAPKPAAKAAPSASPAPAGKTGARDGAARKADAAASSPLPPAEQTLGTKAAAKAAEAAGKPPAAVDAAAGKVTSGKVTSAGKNDRNDKAAKPGTTAKPGDGGDSAKAGASGEPLPNYGDLTLPSLRARLRGLPVARVEELLEYERAHADRPDVVRMYEKRIAKLIAQG
ncbi:hypothetical protein [Bailinhaonella thermotolerans]|uniref:DUF8129 domain-containing protein n=1 Tax=Bailinhaonella thermotolerans TaxID=1070861 RepID=A0A3A4AUU3_9ACTN|nr:hypothetical protein [Bailinhaonella thermotolerans]RJL33365.1 hypothetical protein D5H75_11265 [Bailinhaonella thermotolerans]